MFVTCLHDAVVVIRTASAFRPVVRWQPLDACQPVRRVQFDVEEAGHATIWQVLQQASALD